MTEPSTSDLARWQDVRSPDGDRAVEHALHRAASMEDRPARLRALVSCLDLTTLSGTDDPARIDALCDRALDPGPGLPSVAAVCVFPVFVAQAAERLDGSDVTVATVAGGFPHGQLPLDLRVAEVARAVDDGADEIDMVISRGRARAGDLLWVAREVAAHRRAAGGAKLKVILETGELPSRDVMARVGRVALEAGADTLKTSTGKVQPAATLHGAAVLLDQVRTWQSDTGRACGVKPAGGIRTSADALAHAALVEHFLGPGAVHPSRFRIGASSLLDALATDLSN